MKHHSRAVFCAFLFIATAHGEVPNADPAHLSRVAGYKATFTCSSVFLAERSVQQIDADELTRIYADYRAAMTRLPAAEIDRAKGRVSIVYAQDTPPRIALYQGPAFGCVQLPSGATLEFHPPIAMPPVEIDRSRDALAWPDGDRVVESDERNNALDAVVAAAFNPTGYGGAGTATTAVLVVRDGAIVAERYRSDRDMHTPQRTWSVAKSIAGTIIGAAVRREHLAVADRAGLAQWRTPGDPRDAITIEDLLRMSSGLDASPAGNRTDDIYFGGGRVVDHAATRRLVSQPGTQWVYANNDTMLAMRALRERMRDDRRYHRFPFDAVLHRIGMTRTALETEWNGDFVLSSQVWTTARDLARLGLLYLNDGTWNGVRLLPEGWSRFVATPGAAQPRGLDGEPPTLRYGAQFWVYSAASGLPDGSYAAIGNRGQFLVIIPEQEIVIVRLGLDEGTFDIAAFSKAVIGAQLQAGYL